MYDVRLWLLWLKMNINNSFRLFTLLWPDSILHLSSNALNTVLSTYVYVIHTDKNHLCSISCTGKWKPVRVFWNFVAEPSIWYLKCARAMLLMVFSYQRMISYLWNNFMENCRIPSRIVFQFKYLWITIQ